MKKQRREAILCCLGLVLFATPAWAESGAREQVGQAEVRRVPASATMEQSLPEAVNRDPAMLLAQMSKEVAGKVYHALQGEGDGQTLAGRIGVVNAVPLSDLKGDTEFGRVMAEYLLTDLADRGLRVTELRLGKEITVLPQTGEFILSRNLGELADKKPVLAYAMVSTFSNTSKTLIVQGRLVGLSDGLIRTSWRYALPLTGELRGLFQVAEPPYRIAVKGFSR